MSFVRINKLEAGAGASHQEKLSTDSATKVVRPLNAPDWMAVMGFRSMVLERMRVRLSDADTVGGWTARQAGRIQSLQCRGTCERV